MANYSVSGSLDAARGGLRQYATFRYHAGGSTALQVNRFQYGSSTTANAGQATGSVWVRFGLRQGSTQVTGSLTWTPGTVGTLQYFGVLPMGNYAINGRTSSPSGVYAYMWWFGVLHLIG